ncbi:MAG: hypothetical protein IKU14_03900 [Rhodocyclaceae bacterium]|nr:hypothetical protein [Rhodocyclaceae bacterium]
MARKQFVQHRELTVEGLEVNPRSHFRRRALFIVALAITVGTLVGLYFREAKMVEVSPSAWFGCADQALETNRLRDANRALSEQISKAKMDAEVGRATRQELERQLSQLRGELRDARREIEFMKTASGKPASKPASKPADGKR